MNLAYRDGKFTNEKVASPGYNSRGTYLFVAPVRSLHLIVAPNIMCSTFG
jgi:hypothetical protein